MRTFRLLFFILSAIFSVSAWNPLARAQEMPLNETDANVPQPIVVNGDTVEYSTEDKMFSATGNVSVIYKGATLSCEKLVMNSDTKLAEAQGSVRLDDKAGVILGDKLVYNFEKKTGTITDAGFRSNPYFGRTEEIKKVSETEFITSRGYMTTCSYNNPHYRLKARKMNFFSGNKVQIKDVTVYAGKIPLAYLPLYERHFSDPLMHVQVVPGSSKEWGAFMLSSWRYTVTDDIQGRIYFDARQKLGTAQGFGTNYKTEEFGKGDFKFYYTAERPTNMDNDHPQEGENVKEYRPHYERYLLRLRHRWDIDEASNAMIEYYKIVDSKRILRGTEYNFLKDYFPREYDKDSQPLSYASYHRAFSYSSFDMVLQKRTNRWYSQDEKLPEIKYSLPSIKMWNSPVYFQSISTFVSLNRKQAVPADSSTDLYISRFDTSNRFSMPMKVSIVQITPYVEDRTTWFNLDVNNERIPPRTVFYTGADMSTKFYRIFNLKTNALGLDINSLRHIITPTVGYAYNHAPSISSSRLKQLDTVDSVARNNAFNLELTNKLQTKRKNTTVDLATFRVNSAYYWKPRTDAQNGSSFSNILFKFELMPYSWLSIVSDATLNQKQREFTDVNIDVSFNLGTDRSIGLGQRYQLDGGNEITAHVDWRLNPKWKLSLYQRRNRGNDPTLRRGIIEQEYTVTRDLHCWDLDVSYNIRKAHGSTIWFVMRLKAFPELAFDFNQSYNQPRPGAQDPYLRN